MPSSAGPVLSCRGCHGPAPTPFLSLGRLPVANALPVDPTAAEERYPLEVGLCERCALVQLTWALPAEQLFDADYPYFSSYSEGLVRHAREHVTALVDTRRLGAEAFVVEVASNDGYLLGHLVGGEVRVLGVEPTPGPAAAARDRGVPTVEAFFGRELAGRLRREHGPADVVIANNVMAHVPDLDDFVGGLAHLVADDGLVTVENPGVGALLEHGEFDTVYHEHYCYFSCLSVRALVERHGLRLVHVEEFPDLHGGTLRWHLAHQGEPSATLLERLEDERRRGLGALPAYRDFGSRVQQMQARLREEVQRLRADGATVAAYGAAAKGATLLGSTGLDVGSIDFVVDRNEHKQGRYLPGTGIPVLPVSALLERRPDVVLLLAWNVAAEVVRQQEAYRHAGGRFLVPVPELRYV